MQKFIIDTDIGDDIDDALAISLAAKLNTDIIGITTAYKNTQLRAKMANKLLSLLKLKDVPVYAGHGNSLTFKNPINEMICQYTEDLEQDVYNSLNPEEGADGESAIDFIIEMTEKYGKDLTIIALAPLMNIAKAIIKAPETMKKVGKIVLMGGTFYEQFLEWNILCDPEAAKTVLEFDVPVYCVGTDVTEQCELTPEEIEMATQGGEDPLTIYLAEIVKKWIVFSKRNPILHDPLAVAVAVTGKYVEFEKRMIRVELEGKHTRGMTVNMDHVNRFAVPFPEGKRIFVGKSVEAEAFKEEFFEKVFKK